LRTLGQDRHFRVFYDPRFVEPSSPEAVPSAEDMARQRVEVAEMGYGIEKLQHLPGNVGYVELRGFGPPELVAAGYEAALSLLEGSRALIVDLRRNGGGAPASVALWMSHFFALGDERHLNDIYTRNTGQTQQYWTTPAAGVRYARPVYVLTSARTFSGGEECAYDFQTQRRALLVGQTTGGGANAGDRYSLGHGLVINIPTARAINPVTRTNWEHVGVKPDIEVPAAQAQQTAYVAILRKLAAETTDPEETEQLRHWLALAEQGQSDPPVYEMRR
jgi:C-terminal processing protease CtpA/Prc